MKSLLTLIIGFISLQLLAQAPPQGINYQAVALILTIIMVGLAWI